MTCEQVSIHEGDGIRLAESHCAGEVQARRGVAVADTDAMEPRM